MAQESGRLRRVLLFGFGGIAAVLLLTGLHSFRLLDQIRQDSRQIRQATSDQTARLATVRTSILLYETYSRDFLLEPDDARAGDHALRLRQLWATTVQSMQQYPSTNSEEAQQLSRFRAELEQHWQGLSECLRWTGEERRRQGPGYLATHLAPSRGVILKVSEWADTTGAKRAEDAQAAMEKDFDDLGKRLAATLATAFSAAFVLAAVSMFFVLKLDRQSNERYTELLESRDQLKQLSARMVAAQEDERRSISRELHDEVGQTLGAILVETGNLAGRLPATDETSRQTVERIRTLADQSASTIRNMALLLRPSMLDDLGLIPALEWQAREVARRSGIKVTVDASGVPDDLPEAVRTAVYRVVQEALNNIERHSRATQANIILRAADGMQIQISDNGEGFNTATTKGMGLLGMEERVRVLGGTLTIESRPGGGSRLNISLPLKT